MCRWVPEWTRTSGGRRSRTVDDGDRSADMTGRSQQAEQGEE
jgi:hypothetical protein